MGGGGAGAGSITLEDMFSVLVRLGRGELGREGGSCATKGGGVGINGRA